MQALIAQAEYTDDPAPVRCCLLHALPGRLAVGRSRWRWHGQTPRLVRGSAAVLPVLTAPACVESAGPLCHRCTRPAPSTLQPGRQLEARIGSLATACAAHLSLACP